MPEIGTLSTSVFTGRARIPVRGATVSVMQKDPGGKLTLLAMRVSDDNGLIAPITITTPDSPESQTPGTPLPFTQCDIWVEHPDFGMLVVENIQLFPQVESIQPLFLHPLSETRSDYRTINLVTITPQDL